MRIAALILVVCHPQKLAWIPQTISSIDCSANSFTFDHKILAVDEFNGWTFPQDLEADFLNKGWQVLKDSHTSRPKSMLHGIDSTESDIIFYGEDDVLVNLPARHKVEAALNYILPDGRRCGMCSFNLGGSYGWWSERPDSVLGDLEALEKNTLLKWDDSDVFLRDETRRDEFFFEFPGVFIRKDLLATCLHYSLKHLKGIQIERALTRAWFDLGLHERYFKCSMAKANLKEVANNNPREIFKICRFLSNLDPNQGNSNYFGSHHV